VWVFVIAAKVSRENVAKTSKEKSTAFAREASESIGFGRDVPRRV